MVNRILRFAAAVIAAALLAATPIAANDVSQHPRVKQALQLLEIWLDAQRDFEQIPGLSAAIVHDQEVVWKRAFGFADLDRKIPAKTDTIYSICSISKLFTAVAVMQQRDAGKLRLDDPVAKHLPWFTIKRTDADAPEITIEALLTHSSGLPREAAFPYWTAPDYAFPPREQIIEKLKSQETYFAAQNYFQYSNLGLTLAGEVAAAAAGQPFSNYVRARILEPIGLKDTTPEMPKGGRLATAYSAIQRDGRRTVVNPFAAQGIAPAAGFASTAEDLAKFASWQFRVLERKGGTDVLATNTLREMHRVHWMDPDFGVPWGLGFAVWRDKDHTFVGHGGSCPGFRTQLLMNTSEEVGVIVMANAQGVDTRLLAQRAYEVVGPVLKTAAKADATALESAKKGVAPEKSGSQAQDPSLDAYSGTYATGFAGEIAFVPWEDGLASIGLPTDDPMAGLTKWKKAGPHTFRRVRKDETLAEALMFELEGDKAARVLWHNNIYKRTRSSVDSR
jgi:CubicO group peptidase (beta-lactamase class C family)